MERKAMEKTTMQEEKEEMVKKMQEFEKDTNRDRVE